MTRKRGDRPTMDQPAVYQIKVPGEIDFGRTEWVASLAVTVELEDNLNPLTVLTGQLDQAALHGLLRGLYALGVPLISVVWRSES